MPANPQTVGALKAVLGFVEVVQPYDRPLNLDAGPLHPVGDHRSRLDDVRLSVGEVGAQLVILDVLIDNNRREERDRDGEHAGQHRM